MSVLRQQNGKQHAGRYLDDEIAAVGATGAIVSVMGPQGSGCRGRHVALPPSRQPCAPGFVPALVLYIQYCTTRERGNTFDIERYQRDPVRRLAVQHSAASLGGEVSAPHQMDN